MGYPAPIIDRPQDLCVPEPEKFYAVLSKLTDSGRGGFILEVLEALSSAQGNGDLRPVQRTLDAWWRSSQFAGAPRIEAAFANAASAPDHERRYSADEIAELLGVE